MASNGLAVITLDRPRALNAVNSDMARGIMALLEEWENTPAVKAVLVEGSTPRAFCSGGDVKWMTTVSREQMGMEAVARLVFTAEYTLICKIARYSKPYLALMDGITMGFGIGLACHGPYRVATEKTTLAMPENGIGLFPDVGFAHLATKTPGNGTLGAYMAISGGRVSGGFDALFSSLATHYVPFETLPLLRTALLEGDLSGDSHSAVQNLLQKFSKLPDDMGRLKRFLPFIMENFGREKTIQETISGLTKLEKSEDVEVSGWASETLQGIAKGAPVSVTVTQRHLAALATSQPPKELEDLMRLEYHLARHMACREDFVEGVRAVLVDRDQKPRWQPISIDNVKDEYLNSLFGSDDDEPGLPV